MVLRVRTEFVGLPGAPWLSTMVFTDLSPTDPQDAVTAVGAFWTSLGTIIANDVDWATLPDVEQFNVVTGALEGVTGTTPVTGSGQSTGAVLAGATQALIRWRTGVIAAGREVRGRTFIPGLTSLSLGDPGVAAGTITALQNAGNALLAVDPPLFLVWSREHGVAHPPTVASVWNRFAVLRSRRD